MRVHVENDLFISSDGRQYTVERLTVTQSGENVGKESYNGLGYFTSLQGCIKFLVKMKISESAATTLGELMTALEQINEDIHKSVLGSIE